MTYKIVSKYIKNLDFKIPSAKSYYLLEKNIKNYRVKIDVTSKKINDMVVEIDTNLYFEPKNKNTDNFKISIIYSAVVNFEKGIDKEQLEKVVLIETPTAVFPDISKIVSSLFEKSGFKQFSLPEMDFKKFYEERKKN